MEKGEIKYDVIVIGGGAAGIESALAISSDRKNVCLIEAGKLGGECPNWACIPSKAMARSAQAYYFAKFEMKKLGVHAESITYNYSDIMKHKSAVVSVITGNDRLEKLLKVAKVDLIRGRASFVDEYKVKVGRKIYQAKKIIIATGANGFVPPITGLKESGYLTFKDAVTKKSPPKSIGIIGGGAVACEFASFYALLGIKVTMFEIQKTILQFEDSEISILAEKSLKDLGVKLFTNTKALSVSKRGLKRFVTYQTGQKKRQTVAVDQVLVAVGKKANTERLGLEKAGVKLDKHGNIATNEKLQTNKKHIFAIGDVSGGMQLTSVAHYEGGIVAHNVLARSAKTMRERDLKIVPTVVFLKHEVASVGLTADETAKKKIRFNTHKFSTGSLARSVTDNDRFGLMKIITEKKTGKLLGGHIIGPRAGEMIHEIGLGIKLGATLADLQEMIHAFPTYSEAISALE